MRESSQPKSNEHRSLSLVSGLVFLFSFVVYLFFDKLRTISSLIDGFGEYAFLFVLVPVIIPMLALVRLIRLRVCEDRVIPFFDGWFVHLLILVPYVIAFIIAVARSQ